jgi:hypothetical protein
MGSPPKPEHRPKQSRPASAGVGGWPLRVRGKRLHLAHSRSRPNLEGWRLYCPRRASPRGKSRKLQVMVPRRTPSPWTWSWRSWPRRTALRPRRPFRSLCENTPVLSDRYAVYQTKRRAGVSCRTARTAPTVQEAGQEVSSWYLSRATGAGAALFQASVKTEYGYLRPASFLVAKLPASDLWGPAAVPPRVAGSQATGYPR